MTDPFAQTLHLLTTDQYLCRCGSIPVLDYEPGAITIQCPKCSLSFTAPDADVRGVLEGWLEMTKI